MKLEDYEDIEESKSKSGSFAATLVVLMAVLCIVIFGVVLIVNKDKLITGHKAPEATPSTSSEENPMDLISGNSIVSGDLDIWEEFQSSEQDGKTIIEEKPSEAKEDDPSVGGTKTKVVKADGSEEWVAINKYLPLNTYDNASFVLNGGRLSYYEDGKKISYTGIYVDKYSNYVDYNKVKKDGIDFVMIMLGSRTYSTGQLVLDENFYDNIKRAKDAGLFVGVVFSSQAINGEEALEEAEFVINALKDIDIDYPICYKMCSVTNDVSRIDRLSSTEKTDIAKTFINRISLEGENTIVYGNKEWLLKKLNYGGIAAEDIWLDQFEDLPDFPYRFHMWGYGQGIVDGNSGKTDLIISFIDYSVK